MSRTLRGKCRVLVAAVLLLSGANAFCADPPARALFVAGRVTTVHDGQEHPLYKGASVDVGDEVRTGPGSNVQLRFSDASIVSLKPDTNFIVANYYFNGHDDGSEKLLFNLLRGGLRTVTGVIGHLNHANYAVTTPTATIGIRGTVWSATHCVADECKNDDGTTAKPGTYGDVNVGAIALTNDTPEVVFGAHTAFYVASRASAPERLLVAPHFVAVGLQTRASTSSSSSASAAGVGGQGAQGISVSAPSTALAVTDASGAGASGASGSQASTVQLGYVASDNTTPSGSSASLGSSGAISGVTGFIAEYTVGTNGADYVKTCYGCSGQQGQNSAITSFSFANSGQVLSWSSVTGPQALTQTAPLASNSQTMNVDTGEVFVGQLVGDYRGVPTYGGTFSGPGGLVYIATNSPLVGPAGQGIGNPTSGSFTFGGPGAFIGLGADSAGNAASISRFTATFNAGTGVMAFSGAANFASVAGYGPANFNLSGSANVEMGGNYLPLSATCSGSGCAASTATGYWNGGFLNSSTAIHAAVITGNLYNATKNSGSGNAMVFVAGLKCVSGHC